MLLIILPVVLSLLLDLPVVQNYVVHKVAAMVSQKLETTVSIGHVDIGLFNKLKVDDIYVEDYQRDTLLYAGHVEALVTGFGIKSDGIILGQAKVRNAKFYLRETPSGDMNIKQITDRLSNPDKPQTGNFKLTILSADLDDVDFCLESRDRKNPPYGIDFTHMHLYDIAARVSDLTIDGSTIHVDIGSLAARERSGFVLNDLSGCFYLTDGCMGFKDISITTGHSNLKMPYVSLVGNSWAEYKDFISQVRIDAAVSPSTLSTDDVAYFAPSLRDWHLTFSGIDLQVAGTVDDFTTSVSNLGAGPDTQVVLEAAVRGLPDLKTTHFDLDLRRLISSATDIDRLAEGITGKKLPEKIVRFIDNAGRPDLTARFVGLLSSFHAQASLATKVGRADCNLTVQPVKGGRSQVEGVVSTRNFRVGELLGIAKLGGATLAAKVNGVMGKGYADAKVSAEISKLGFSGYVYDSLRLDGRIANKEFDGRITARDPNLDFDFQGAIDLNDSVPRYDFDLNLRRADLVKMHLNPRDSISELSARVIANATGRSLDDLNGEIRVSDVLYRYNVSEVKAKQLIVRGQNSLRSKYVELRSDFADATFRSRTSYREVYEYLKMSAWKYLPMLYDKDKYVSREVQATAAVDDYSLLSIQIKDINPVVDALSRGLQIADSSQLQLLFNPASDKLLFKASSEYVERDRLLATKIHINAANHGDSLAFYAASEDFYLGTLHLSNLSVMGGAREGRMQVTTGFSDSLKHTSGLLGFRAALLPDPGPNGPVLQINILPSHITRGDKTWRIFSRRIEMDTAKVVIDRFMVMNDQQDLLINGTASRSRSDSVQIRLRNFDLSPFTQFVDRMGYAIEGVTNGSATIKSALSGSEITADIRLDSLKVNGISAPPLELLSQWDFQRNRAGFMMRNRVKQDTLVQGFYAPSQVRYYARVGVDSLDIGLIDPVLKGVISNTKGYANVDLVLTGQRREVELRGQVRVSGLSTKVDFTQVTYTVPDVVFHVENNHFRVQNTSVFDPEGNKGGLDFDLNLEHLSNIAYRVHVTPDQLLVLNTTQQDNDLFYGTVYASGNATISGDKRGVNMDIAATTEKHSTFNMPMSDKSNISSAKFVTFKEPIDTALMSSLERKKQLFERRKSARAVTESSMNISLALDVRPNLDFQMLVAGNVIKGRGAGILNLQINPRQNIFEMYGDYTIAEGSFQLSIQDIIRRKFIIENGSTIQWTGAPANALLDINAIYKLKASLTPLLQGTTTNNISGDRSVPVECIIHLSDRLTNPSMTFDVRVPSSDSETQAMVSNALNSREAIQTQFFFLLMSNSFLSESSSAAANVGVSASAATGFEFLSNQLSNWLSFSDYNVLISYRPKSEMTGDELDFGLSKSLINDRLFVEVEGNYVVDNKQAVNRNMSNFMGEAYVTWLIDRAGTLKLKGFTQTIDRFDENQGLQETGIGIYYKEDFNNLKDLRQRIKDRFTSKKRKAQREQKKQAQAAAAIVLKQNKKELK